MSPGSALWVGRTTARPVPRGELPSPTPAPRGRPLCIDLDGIWIEVRGAAWLRVSKGNETRILVAGTVTVRGDEPIGIESGGWETALDRVPTGLVLAGKQLDLAAGDRVVVEGDGFTLQHAAPRPR